MTIRGSRRLTRTQRELSLLLRAAGEGAPNTEQKLAAIAKAKQEDPQLVDWALSFFVGETDSLRNSLREAHEEHRELLQALDKMLEPPWHVARALAVLDLPQGPRTLVQSGSTQMLVQPAAGIEMCGLRRGEPVFIDRAGNTLVGRCQEALPVVGETANFERRIGPGRVLVSLRDETFVAQACDGLDVEELTAGQPVLWDRNAGLVLEALEPAEARRYLFDRIEPIGRAEIGGQDENVEALLDAIVPGLVDPGRARDYGLDGRTSVLLVGPPGTGKTLMARLAASKVQELSGCRCNFGIVRPGEFLSPWVGETERNIRECFAALREATADGSKAVLLLDEVDSVGRMRGSSVGHHSDRFLAALLAEIDGFESRGDVAIVATTNRKDLLDEAFLQRIADVEIVVKRPTLEGAREIFAVHLKPEIPYDGSAAGGDFEKARRDAIETATSLLYGPNADNQLCTLHLRDGTSRVVRASELVSGRLIEQICRSARRRAFKRCFGSGREGLGQGDMIQAVDEALERLATSVTRQSAHGYLGDLPQDVDVVRVEPRRRAGRRIHQYLRAA